mmetsp:Transcript_13769/g.17370  ORF Transcript_13769/g.17370 Transcript_13769/m.17370 type:complete len:86 (-) Transcript_13769:28-285(-)
MNRSNPTFNLSISHRQHDCLQSVARTKYLTYCTSNVKFKYTPLYVDNDSKHGIRIDADNEIRTHFPEPTVVAQMLGISSSVMIHF